MWNHILLRKKKTDSLRFIFVPLGIDYYIENILQVYVFKKLVIFILTITILQHT